MSSIRGMSNLLCNAICQLVLCEAQPVECPNHLSHVKPWTPPTDGLFRGGMPSSLCPQAWGKKESDREREVAILAQVSGNGGPAPPCPPGLEPHAVSQTRCPLAPRSRSHASKPWGAHHPMRSLMRKWTIAEKPPRQSLQCCFSKDSLQLS